jgi:hypothetical protein
MNTRVNNQDEKMQKELENHIEMFPTELEADLDADNVFTRFECVHQFESVPHARKRQMWIHRYLRQPS